MYQWPAFRYKTDSSEKKAMRDLRIFEIAVFKSGFRAAEGGNEATAGIKRAMMNDV